jgi:hypothetical protein
MLTLKKYLAMAALSLTIISPMSAMEQNPLTPEQQQMEQKPLTPEQQQEVNKLVNEAQKDYQTGNYNYIPYKLKTPTDQQAFKNIVCDGNTAFATLNNYTHTKYHYYAYGDGKGQPSNWFQSRLQWHELGTCKDYFALMVAINNNPAMKQSIKNLDGDYKTLDLVPDKDQGNFAHMWINGNIKLDENNGK